MKLNRVEYDRQSPIVVLSIACLCYMILFLFGCTSGHYYTSHHGLVRSNTNYVDSPTMCRDGTHARCTSSGCCSGHGGLIR